MNNSDPEVPDRETKDKATEEGAPVTKRSNATPLAEKIGFAKLDLTIDEVEERISPRETNVFDK